MAPQILVLEDDPDQQILLCDALTADGHECLTVGTVDQAEAMLNTHTIDLAILDMNLPGRPGTDALSYIRSKPELAKTPVIVVTANPQFNREADALGTDLFLVKPLNLMELQVLVRRCLRL